MSNLSALELRRMKELQRARAQGARRVQQAAERQARGLEAENAATAADELQQVAHYRYERPNSAVHHHHPASATSSHHSASSLLHHPTDISSPRHMDVARHMAEEHRLRSQFPSPVATHGNSGHASYPDESDGTEVSARAWHQNVGIHQAMQSFRARMQAYMTPEQLAARGIPLPSSSISAATSVNSRAAPATQPISHDQRPIRPSHPPSRGVSSSSQSFEHRLNAVMAARAAERENYARAQFEQQEREELAEHKSSMDKAADALKPFPVTAAWKRIWQTKTHTGECAICLDQFRLAQQIIQLPSCSHAFHEPCLSHWLVRQSTCPTCRFDIKRMRPANQIHRSEEDDEEFSL